MFRAGWTIADYRGIPIRVHPSLLVVLPILAIAIASQNLPERFVSLGVPLGAISLPSSLYGIGLAVSLFGAVLLHEMGHATMALRFGMPVRAITLSRAAPMAISLSTHSSSCHGTAPRMLMRVCRLNQL